MHEQRLKELLSPDNMIERIVSIHKQVRETIGGLRQRAYELKFIETSSGLKGLATVDLLAETSFRLQLLKEFGEEDIEVIGEESLHKDFRVLEDDRIWVLVDMIDGTDLLQRGFSNWCSAIVVFRPKDQKILGAYVALLGDSLNQSKERGWLYYANDDGAFKKPLRLGASTVTPLRVPRGVDYLSEASVCAYAQKAESLRRLIKLSERPKISEWLQETAESLTKGGERFRFYNLAGNPMMVRLAEGIVHVVFELHGQAPHDMLPGLYIAIKAGAVVGKPAGDALMLSELSSSLLEPGSARVAYILASNAALLGQFVTLVN